MREIIIGDIRISVRPLTVGEIRELKDVGYSYFGCSPESIDVAQDCVDLGLEKVLDRGGLDYLAGRPLKDSITVWKGLLAETYGAPDEEKNLQSASDGSQTGSESNTVKSAAQ